MPGNSQSYQASIRTNSTSNCAIRFVGNVDIFGDVMIGTGGNPTTVIDQSGGAVVWGQQQVALNAVVMDPVIVPPGVPSSGDLILDGASSPITLPAGTYFFDNIELLNGASILTDGQVVIYVRNSTRADNAMMKGQIGGVNTPAASSVQSFVVCAVSSGLQISE